MAFLIKANINLKKFEGAAERLVDSPGETLNIDCHRFIGLYVK